MWHTIHPVRTIDYHTAGEPFRIVVDGAPELVGATVGERRAFAQQSPEVDRFRQLLCREPRGHLDMYGCFLTPPDDDGADFGTLFWHNEGYSTACGHGTMALGAWAVRSGLVASDPDGTTPVTIDVPSGRVVAEVRQNAGVITGITFRNVPSYPVARAVTVGTSRATLTVDLGWGGTLYATLDASTAGLSVTSEHYADLVALGREIKWALNDSEHAQHPTDPRLSGVYGTIIFDDLGDTDAGPHQRNITVFGDGWVDRSPCGSGTATRVALLADEGRLAAGQTLTHDSIVGTRFLARALSAPEGMPAGAVIPEVEGMAYQTGEHSFMLEDGDPVGTGFVIR